MPLLDRFTIRIMKRYYYEVNKVKLQGLEAIYGLPDSIVTRSWETVSTRLDNLYVIIESSRLLDPLVIGSEPLTELEASNLRYSAEYHKEEII